MYAFILADVATSIYSNLRILKAQMLALRAFGVDPIDTPVHVKYRMFVRLSYITLLFVILELSIHRVFTGQPTELYWLFVLLHQLMELVVAVGIGHTFRAQPFNVLFQQVQRVAAELAEQLMPSITTVQLKEGELQAKLHPARSSLSPSLCLLPRNPPSPLPLPSPNTPSPPNTSPPPQHPQHPQPQARGGSLIAWRPDIELGGESARSSRGGEGSPARVPETLIVLNPGDEEMPQPQPGRVARGRIATRTTAGGRACATVRSRLESR